MSFEKKVGHNEEECFFKDILYTRSWEKLEKQGHIECKLCIICENKFKVGNRIYMILNNFVHFPNCIAHAFCVEDLGFKDSIKEIILKYEMAKKMKLFYSEEENLRKKIL